MLDCSGVAPVGTAVASNKPPADSLQAHGEQPLFLLTSGTGEMQVTGGRANFWSANRWDNHINAI